MKEKRLQIVAACLNMLFEDDLWLKYGKEKEELHGFLVNLEVPLWILCM